jgi:2-polyprenyl-3-methyl-5-hydroxy-6-metoxy-1,4-benzoquinol methylase
MSQYDSYSQWKDWHLNFSCSDLEERYYELEFGRLVLPGSRIVEIGFGNGGFLDWAKRRGAEVYGVEIQPEILEAANRHGFKAVQFIEELLSYRGDGFDLAVALDVFEHIPPAEVPRALQQIESLLKVTGTLTLRVPNGLSPFGRLNQHGDATHTTVVTPAKVKQWAIGTNLELQDVRNEARVPVGKSIFRRSSKRVQFLVRDGVNKLLAKIYGFPTSTLDPNLIIVLKKIAV